MNIGLPSRGDEESASRGECAQEPTQVAPVMRNLFGGPHQDNKLHGLLVGVKRCRRGRRRGVLQQFGFRDWVFAAAAMRSPWLRGLGFRDCSSGDAKP